MRLIHRGLTATSLLMLAFLCGCGGSDGRGAKLAPVKGRVIFKNEGVTAANIYFMPDAAKGNNGSMASAVLEPIPVAAFSLITQQRSISGSPSAPPVTIGNMLDWQPPATSYS